MRLLSHVTEKIFDPALHLSLLRVLRLWKPFAVWTLGVWLLFLLFVSPFTAWVFGMELFQPANQVIGNADILVWLLRPVGMLWLSGFIALNALATALRFSGIFILVRRDLEHAPLAVLWLLRQSIRMLPRLFVVSFVAVGMALLTFLPLLAGFLAIYYGMLGEFDINYYLTEHPPVWTRARLLAGAWTLLWATAACYVLGRLLLLFPAYLTHDYSLKKSVRAAWGMARTRGHQLLRRLLVVFGLGAGARIVLDGLWLLLARITLLRMQASPHFGPRPQALVTGGYVLTSFLTALIIGFLTFSVAATVLTKFYFEDTPLHATALQRPLPHPAPAAWGHRLVAWGRPRRLVPLVGTLLLISGAVSIHWLRKTPPVGDVIISAHRTGPPPAPENTLAALEAAIATGADYTEIDVQLTRDGVVIVVHDEDWMRVAGSPLRVADATYAEVQHLLQTHPSGEKSTEESADPSLRRVATLAEFIEHAQGRIHLMIELKYYGFHPRLAEETLRVLQDAASTDPVLLMSLDLAAVRQLRALAPEHPVGYVSGVSLGNLSQLDVDFLAVTRRAATPRLLKAARRQGMPVHVWTINRKEDMIDLMLKGVDGLITDDPALALATLKELQDLTAIERLLLRFFHFTAP